MSDPETRAKTREWVSGFKAGIRAAKAEVRKRCRHWGVGRGACDACAMAIIVGAVEPPQPDCTDLGEEPR